MVTETHPESMAKSKNHAGKNKEHEKYVNNKSNFLFYKTLIFLGSDKANKDSYLHFEREFFPNPEKIGKQEHKH